MSPLGPWRSLASRGTLVTGLLSVLVLSLSHDWRAAFVLVLLLYVHELGHVMAAHWRGVRIWRPPLFLPGFGAFVTMETGPARTTTWDDVIISLAGPIVGSVAAFLTVRAGLAWQMEPVAFAGQIGLYLNLLNLAPFPPLDGGRVTARIGWMGLLLMVAVGGWWLYNLGSLFWGIVIVFGIASTLRAVRSAPPVGWGTRLGVLAVHLLTIVAVLLMAFASGRLRHVPVARPDWLPTTNDIFTFVFLWLMVSLLAYPQTQKPGMPLWARYLGAALFGWSRMLPDHPWRIPLSACLGLAALGLPGLRWLERLVAWLARRQPGDAAHAAFAAYQLLEETGRPGESLAWCERIFPVLAAGDPVAPVLFIRDFVALGDPQRAREWADRWLESTPPAPASLPAPTANVIAWTLAVIGRVETALAYARRAHATDPANPDYQDTLGRVLVETGSPAEAETYLRQAILAKPYLTTRVFLARALGDQGRLADALTVAEPLLKYDGPWPADLPRLSEVRIWIRQWQTDLAEG